MFVGSTVNLTRCRLDLIVLLGLFIHVLSLCLAAHGMPPPITTNSGARISLLPPSLDPAKTITLYHGTKDHASKTSLEKNGIKLDKTTEGGDYSPSHAFYLTNTFRAAAQWACYENEPYIFPNIDRMQTVYVLEYVWVGTSAKTIFQWDLRNRKGQLDRGRLNDWKTFCNTNVDYSNASPLAKKASDKIRKGKDMIVGPMGMKDDSHLTPNFWQYAVITEKGANKLKLVKIHTVSCMNVPPDATFSTTDTQGPSSAFSKTVKKELNIADSGVL